MRFEARLMDSWNMKGPKGLNYEVIDRQRHPLRNIITDHVTREDATLIVEALNAREESGPQARAA